MARWLAGALAVPFLLGAAATPADRAQVVCTFNDPAIVESSGLAVVDGLVVTTNDSGDSGRVFTVDPGTGDTVGVAHWAEEPVDVEALAPDGRGSVWVADIGDNGESRDEVSVTLVPVGRGTATVDAASYQLTYPDGPHDAESLLADPASGRLYVVTKDVLGGDFYAAPETLSADQPNRMRRLGPALALATDAAFFPDRRHLIVRNYGRATVYGFPSLAAVGSVDLPRQRQGEGIAVDHTGRVLLSSEGRHSDVLEVPLPQPLREAMTPSESSPSASASPTVPTDHSGTDSELPQSTDLQRPGWPWLLSGLIGLAIILVLLRSLRPR